MGDGACTVAPSFTLRVTIVAFTRPLYQWCERGRWPREWCDSPGLADTGALVLRRYLGDIFSLKFFR